MMTTQNYLDWGATGIVDFGAELRGTSDVDLQHQRNKSNILLPKAAGSDGMQTAIGCCR